MNTRNNILVYTLWHIIPSEVIQNIVFEINEFPSTDKHDVIVIVLSNLDGDYFIRHV